MPKNHEKFHSANGKRLILIADDEMINRELLANMLEDELVCNTLGKHIITQYTEGKYAEWDEYRTAVSDWEVSKYLMMY